MVKVVRALSWPYCSTWPRPARRHSSSSTWWHSRGRASSRRSSRRTSKDSRLASSTGTCHCPSINRGFDRYLVLLMKRHQRISLIRSPYSQTLMVDYKRVVISSVIAAHQKLLYGSGSSCGRIFGASRKAGGHVWGEQPTRCSRFSFSTRSNEAGFH